MGLKQYRIIKAIQSGVGTESYRGERLSGEPVLIKMIDITLLKRWKPVDLFLREIAALKQLDTPGIPEIIDHFREGEQLYLVQRWIDGVHLGEMIQRGERFDDAMIITLVRNLLNILKTIHHAGIIHRDIKPENIIRDPSGRYHLVDFGAIATTLNRGGPGSTIVGSSGYTPPEQLIGEAKIRSDLYAFGVTLIAVLTGREPHQLEMEQLRYRYREHLFISKQFAALIDRLTDPVISKRFFDADIVLKKFGDGEMVREGKQSFHHNKTISGKTGRGELISGELRRIPLYLNLNQNRVKQLIHPGTKFTLLSESVYQNSEDQLRIRVEIEGITGWFNLDQTTLKNYYNTKKQSIQRGKNIRWMVTTALKIASLCGGLYFFL